MSVALIEDADAASVGCLRGHVARRSRLPEGDRRWRARRRDHRDRAHVRATWKVHGIGVSGSILRGGSGPTSDLDVFLAIGAETDGPLAKLANSVLTGTREQLLAG